MSDMRLIKETLRFLDINMGPTIKSDVTTSMLCHKEEIFEPILLDWDDVHNVDHV